MRFYRRASALLIAAACGGETGPLPPGDELSLARETVSDQLVFPVDLASPPGDSRLFVVEKAGRIRIIQNGTLLAPAFLDISAQVSSSGERGLLGLAFDPEYGTTGRFVVNYTDLDGDTHIAAFTVSPGDPNRADAASEVLILRVDQPFENTEDGHESLPAVVTSCPNKLEQACYSRLTATSAIAAFAAPKRQLRHQSDDGRTVIPKTSQDACDTI